ncbi:MAG TPA: carboxypeptidase regulatory-like domain-containing protein, partial [Polyangiaceae bacterium]|nr:carboxypeptidase regulatory-like domain-containing protein [Polyangiaceae bacterium]
MRLLSDDGQGATTGEDGSAELELGAGQRSLRLQLPLTLTPAYSAAEPKVIRLDGIDLGSGQTAVLNVLLDASGEPSSLELQALPPPVAAAAASVSSAPGAVTGTVNGQVLARASGALLQGVSIFVEGQDAQTTSDASGRFSLALPVGRYSIWIIHEDFPSLNLPNVEVNAGRDTPIQVELLKPAPRQDDWVIRASYVSGGVASILEERRQASTVSDALGSEEIAKSPDSSASSATRRIVGASIVGGQYLFARGLGGRYTNVRLNGVPLPSTDPDLP